MKHAQAYLAFVWFGFSNIFLRENVPAVPQVQEQALPSLCPDSNIVPGTS